MFFPFFRKEKQLMIFFFVNLIKLLFELLPPFTDCVQRSQQFILECFE